MSMNEKEIMAVSEAMMADLVKAPKKGGNHGCLLMFMPRYPDNVCVKGHVDLTSFAAVAIETLDRMRAKGKVRRKGP
jgi:hypothetical protein